MGDINFGNSFSRSTITKPHSDMYDPSIIHKGNSIYFYLILKYSFPFYGWENEAQGYKLTLTNIHIF